MPHLVTNVQLEQILQRRARRESVKDLAEEYGISPPQVSGILHRCKSRFHHICETLGVSPPRHGGWDHGGYRRDSGRQKVPDEKHSRYNVNYHPDVKQAEEGETTTLTCLKCREEFESEDRCGNRLCKHCKSLHTWNEGADFSTHIGMRRAQPDY